MTKRKAKPKPTRDAAAEERERCRRIATETLAEARDPDARRLLRKAARRMEGVP